MSREEVFQKLNEVFREEFDDEEILVKEDTTAKDIEGWDSLEHIDLIAAVEDAFSVHFSMAEVTSMKNVGEMADRIMEKL